MYLYLLIIINNQSIKCGTTHTINRTRGEVSKENRMIPQENFVARVQTGSHIFHCYPFWFQTRLIYLKIKFDL